MSRFALLGDPVSYSKSPAMHAAAYRALGLAHTYEAIRVDQKDLGRHLGLLRDGTFRGFNVTVPYKRAILAHVDRVDVSAEMCDAANTLVCEGGVVVAHNTDAPALAEEIRRLAPDASGWSDVTALVLGTGGAARAAIVALAGGLGVARVVVRGRAMANRETRDDVLAEVRASLGRAGARARLDAEPWVASRATERESLVVVQATSLGMSGAGDGEAAVEVVDWSAVPLHAVALDVVYTPTVTPFLRAAGARGLRSTNGLGMLARQGQRAFELWLGVPAPFEAMLAALA